MPVVGELVFVSLTHQGERSQPLSAMTDPRGYWQVDLGNLKRAGGGVLSYQPTDTLHIRYAGESREVEVPLAEFGPQFVGVYRLSLLAMAHTGLVPASTALYQNYPNPFNPETWIPYQLSEAADVTIRIYAAGGQLVRTLSLGHQLAGYYTAKSKAAYWDGRNKLGESVASGVYFYTLEVGHQRFTKKLTILR